MLGQLKQQSFFLTQESTGAQTRADSIITEMNSTAGRLESTRADFQTYSDSMRKQTADSLNAIVAKFKLDGENNKVEINVIKAKMEEVATDGAKRLQKQGEELEEKINTMYAWSVRFQNDVKAKFGAEDANKGNFDLARGDKVDKKTKLDKKEIMVGQVPDAVTKVAWRHWLRAVDLQLENTYDFTYPELVLHRVRLSKVEITKSVLASIITFINEEYKTEILLKGEDSECDKLNVEDWDFEMKSRWLYIYMYTKLNADIAQKTLHIEERNGLEVYRVVNNLVDAIPENAQLYLECEFGELVKECAGKVKNLKDTCAFKGKLKVKAAEYHRIVGEHPTDDKLKQTLWNVLDLNTKQSLTTTGHASKSYKEISDHLDQLYNTQYGAIDFAKNSGDDPMGLSKLGLGDKEEDAGEEEGAEGQYDLDAFGKGKGKGKGKDK